MLKRPTFDVGLFYFLVNNGPMSDKPMKFLCLLVISFLGIVLTHQTSDHWHESKPIIYPARGMEHFTLGFNGSVADSMWIRLIQDFGFCENNGPGGAVYP